GVAASEERPRRARGRARHRARRPTSRTLSHATNASRPSSACQPCHTSLGSPLFSVTPALVEERCRFPVLLAIRALDQSAHFFFADRLPLAHLEHDAEEDRPKRQHLGEDNLLARLRAIALREFEDRAPA